MAAASYYQLNQLQHSNNHHPPQPDYSYHGAYSSSHTGPIPTHHSPQPTIAPTAEPLLKPKPGFSVTSSGSQPPSLYNDSGDPNVGPDRLDVQKQQQYTRWQRVSTLLSKLTTVVFAGIMFAIMVYIVVTHQRTRVVVRGGRTPWPKETKVWPTYMLLGASGVALGLAIFTLAFYCCSFERARRSWKMQLVKNVVSAIIWIGVSAIYRYEKSTNGVDNDLWGWSCSPKALAIQAEFQDVINFQPLCRAQVIVHPHPDSLHAAARIIADTFGGK